MMATDGATSPEPSKPDLLFLVQRIPYPPNKGEKIRHYQFLRHLAKSHNVHLGCLIDDPSDWDHVDTVKSWCADTHFARLDRGRDALSHLGALATGSALSVNLYRDARLARWTSGVLDRVRPKIVFVGSSNMAPYVRGRDGRDGTYICDLVDVDSEKWRAYAEKASGPMKWLYGREARLVLNLERSIAREADYCTFVSEAEARMFRSLAPDQADRIVGISNGVDSDYFDPAGIFAPPFDAALPNFVFTGTMDYVPNVDAVRWFAEDILPIVRRTLPDAQFHIVGTSPTPAVQALAGIDHVHVTGRVPDVRPYLAHATAAVAPMRIARGIQNKVLEAMAMARATVVTSDALEGIDATPGAELLLADDADGFASAVCRLAANPSERSRVGQAARRRVVDQFSWDGQLRGFDRLLAR
jgi:sugar transferase (PEP-CTERM/EpsH1 system associated)